MQLALKRTPPSGLFQRFFYFLTKWRLLTDFPHAGIVVDGSVLHANLAFGLHAEPFSPEGWYVVEVADRFDVRAMFARHRDTPYDWFSLLAFVLPWRVRDSSRLYCYEWCWMAMTGESPSVRVTPEMLLALALLQGREVA